MFLNKGSNKAPTTRSNKKNIRRIQTEANEPTHYRKTELSNRVLERNESRQKYLDVYSKLNVKETNTKKKFKVNTHKQPVLNKHLKTEPSESRKKSTAKSGTSFNTKYQIDGVAGKGTFGTVYLAHERGTGHKVAIKKVLQDKRYKNRELEILKTIKNKNVLEMRDFFLTYENSKEYLNVVMDFYPLNLYQVVKKKQLTDLTTKLFMYQILRGLNYISCLSIAHRDIKPQNILVDFSTNKAVICDFGSAKKLVHGEPNLAYICSRCYRAPELIFGATDYTPQIDIWSTGCVLVEMINGQPPFIGDSQIDQLIEIIKILGTPSKEDLMDMNRNYDMKQYGKFPTVKPVDWKSVLKTKDPVLIGLISMMLQYSPHKRLDAAQALMHPFFDDFRKESTYKQIVSQAKKVPQLFDFSKEQLRMFPEHAKPIPQWARNEHQHGASLNKIGNITVKQLMHRFV